MKTVQTSYVIALSVRTIVKGSDFLKGLSLSDIIQQSLDNKWIVCVCILSGISCG